VPLDKKLRLLGVRVGSLCRLDELDASPQDRDSVAQTASLF
jgi:hypothetical protein